MTIVIIHFNVSNLVFVLKWISVVLNLCKISVLWIPILVVILSNDVELHPGPHHRYNGNFSFCNWNLNSLAKNSFERVQLIEAHNSVCSPMT